VTLKALARLLHPVLGHNIEPPHNAERWEKEIGKKRRAPAEAFLSLPFSAHTNPT
jgi:hypothetical protein